MFWLWRKSVGEGYSSLPLSNKIRVAVIVNERTVNHKDNQVVQNIITAARGSCSLYTLTSHCSGLHRGELARLKPCRSLPFLRDPIHTNIPSAQVFILSSTAFNHNHTNNNPNSVSRPHHGFGQAPGPSATRLLRTADWARSTLSNGKLNSHSTLQELHDEISCRPYHTMADNPYCGD